VVPEEEGGGVIVHFRGQEDVCARFVVAADGVRSALRATLLPQDPGPRWEGRRGQGEEDLIF
jgi:2-polyprenyl-6-methoxyphenol hydroxylase-like FAD-dependent oxidoreductase